MEHVKMKDIPGNDRPYEKCLRMGPEGLSDAELLAVIIRTGSRNSNSLKLAEEVLRLNYPGDGILGLCRLSLPELMAIEGIGTVKGIQLLCIGELSRRISKREAVARNAVFRCPEAVADYYMEDLRHLEQEQFYVMLLNTRQMLIRDILISKGTVNASLATPREIFIQALKYQAVGIILVHNHPSGDSTPSREDCLLTKRVYEAGTLIGIQLLDHVVIGDGNFCSLKKEGML